MPRVESRVIVISDATGETASQMVKAALVQFTDEPVSFTRYKNVRTIEQISAICGDAARNNSLIVYTIVSPDLRLYLQKLATEQSIPSVDLLGPLLVGLQNYFQAEPEMTAGLLHNVNEAYFKRIEAMEFTIAHDDGKELGDLDKADLVLLGISRTSKTPISMYLSHQGWKVANIPLINGFELPSEVFAVNQRKIIGLTINEDELVTIRRNRLLRLGQKEGGDYAATEKVYEEVDFANELFRKNRRWAVFNVTGKAIEETASEIIKLMSSRQLVPQQTNAASSRKLKK